MCPPDTYVFPEGPRLHTICLIAIEKSTPRRIMQVLFDIPSSIWREGVESFDRRCMSLGNIKSKTVTTSSWWSSIYWNALMVSTTWYITNKSGSRQVDVQVPYGSFTLVLDVNDHNDSWWARKLRALLCRLFSSWNERPLQADSDRWAAVPFDTRPSKDTRPSWAIYWIPFHLPYYCVPTIELVLGFQFCSGTGVVEALGGKWIVRSYFCSVKPFE